MAKKVLHRKSGGGGDGTGREGEFHNERF